MLPMPAPARVRAVQRAAHIARMRQYPYDFVHELTTSAATAAPAATAIHFFIAAPSLRIEVEESAERGVQVRARIASTVTATSSADPRRVHAREGRR